jgi:hypothetical protein
MKPLIMQSSPASEFERALLYNLRIDQPTTGNAMWFDKGNERLFHGQYQETDTLVLD